MDACDAVITLGADSFESLQAEMSSDLYWVRFFARPCCPAPNAKEATKMLDRLKADVASRDDFTENEKSELLKTIEMRKSWYPSSGLCKSKD